MYNEEMRQFWKRYTLGREKYTMEDRVNILKELPWGNFIHEDFIESFLLYLDEILSQLVIYYEEEKTRSFKQGEMLHAKGAFSSGKKYAETDTTDGKNSGDNEGLEESFINDQRSIKSEIEAIYGKV